MGERGQSATPIFHVTVWQTSGGASTPVLTPFLSRLARGKVSSPALMPLGPALPLYQGEGWSQFQK